MRSEHFRYLLEIDRLHSISSAARTLHVRQTTLSAIVKSLEDELGFPIFRRTPSGVITTPEGEQLIALAWEMDVRCEELLSLKKHDSHRAKSIPILMCPSINLGLAIPLCQRFYRFDLRGDLILSECPRLDICSGILQNTTNIGVTYLTAPEIQQLRHDLPDSNISLTPLMRDQFYLCVPRGHPLAGRAFITEEEFRQERLATVTGFRSGGVKGLQSHIPSDSAQVTFFPNIAIMHRAMLEQGMVGVLTGYAFYHSGTFRQEEFQVIPICRDGALSEIHICLLCREERYLRYQERILSSCLLDYFHSLSPDGAACPSGFPAGNGGAV